MAIHNFSTGFIGILSDTRVVKVLFQVLMCWNITVETTRSHQEHSIFIVETRS